MFAKLNDPNASVPEDDDEDEIPKNIHIENLTDEEDLIVGESMEDGILGSSDDENDVDDDRGDDDYKDIERGKPKKMNIVDVETDDFYDEDNDHEVDSDDESEDENAAVEDVLVAETLRRRNVKSNDCDLGSGIEG